MCHIWAPFRYMYVHNEALSKCAFPFIISCVRICRIWTNKLVPIFKRQISSLLTTHEDLQLAQGYSSAIRRRLKNEISVRRHVAATLQIDCSTVWNGAGILTTHVVVPQCRCRGAGWDVRHADNEVVQAVSYKSSPVSSWQFAASAAEKSLPESIGVSSTTFT